MAPLYLPMRSSERPHPIILPQRKNQVRWRKDHLSLKYGATGPLPSLAIAVIFFILHLPPSPMHRATEENESDGAKAGTQLDPTSNEAANLNNPDSGAQHGSKPVMVTSPPSPNTDCLHRAYRSNPTAVLLRHSRTPVRRSSANRQQMGTAPTGAVNVEQQSSLSLSLSVQHVWTISRGFRPQRMRGPYWLLEATSASGK